MVVLPLTYAAMSHPFREQNPYIKHSNLSLLTNQLIVLGFIKHGFNIIPRWSVWFYDSERNEETQVYKNTLKIISIATVPHNILKQSRHHFNIECTSQPFPPKPPLKIEVKISLRKNRRHEGFLDD